MNEIFLFEEKPMFRSQDIRIFCIFDESTNLENFGCHHRHY